MKILFISRSAADLSIGGIAEVLSNLTRTLPLLGVQVFVYVPGELNIENPIDGLGNGTPCYSGPFLKPGWKAFFSKRKQLQPLLELIKKLDIDIVHTCGLYRAGYVALQLKKQLDIPYVVTSHGDILTSSSDRIKRNSVKKRCKTILQNADAVTHLTSEMANAAHEIFDSSNASFIIPNGINLSMWSSTVNPENFALAIGRLVREKGFHVLIAAFSVLFKEGLTTSLVIAGEGDYQHELVLLAKQLGLNVVFKTPQNTENIPEKSICFVGNVKGDIKINLYGRSKMVLFATQPHLTEESFGLVPFEAFAAKKILLASALLRIKQLEENGFNIDVVEQADNPQSWSRHIKTHLENDAVDQAITNKNYALLKDYDWMLIAKQYQDVYSYVLKNLQG
jgi:glycosyltransferase involved in cell wall biosynthesis